MPILARAHAMGWKDWKSALLVDGNGFSRISAGPKTLTSGVADHKSGPDLAKVCA